MNPFRWAAFLAAFGAQCTAIQLTQFPIFFIVRPFSLPAFRRYVRWTQRQWASTIVAITATFSPTRLVVSGVDDAILGNAIVIANHQTFADWWYMWCWAYTKNQHGSFKIILKNSLKNIPIWGWGMQFFEFIFLRRNWELDQKNVERVLNSYKEPSHAPFLLVIFPEGTIIRESSREHGKAYAAKNNLPMPQHMLVPRATGLRFCTTTLRSTVPYIYDFTIGYKGVQAGQIPSTVFKLRSIFLDGKGPPEVHMHIRKIPLKDVPNDEKGFTEWITKVFAEKDALLDKFYREGSFAPVRNTYPVKLRKRTEVLAIWAVLATQIALGWCAYNLVVNYLL